MTIRLGHSASSFIPRLASNLSSLCSVIHHLSVFFHFFFPFVKPSPPGFESLHVCQFRLVRHCFATHGRDFLRPYLFSSPVRNWLHLEPRPSFHSAAEPSIDIPRQSLAAETEIHVASCAGSRCRCESIFSPSGCSRCPFSLSSHHHGWFCCLFFALPHSISTPPPNMTEPLVDSLLSLGVSLQKTKLATPFPRRCASNSSSANNCSHKKYSCRLFEELAAYLRSV